MLLKIQQLSVVLRVLLFYYNYTGDTNVQWIYMLQINKYSALQVGNITLGQINTPQRQLIDMI